MLPEPARDTRILGMDIASTDDFSHVDLSSLTTLSSSLDFHDLETALDQASRIAKEQGQLATYRSFRVLAVACSYHFDVERADVFSAQSRDAEYRRLIPDDFRGEQTLILSTIAPAIDHPLIRARIADICWYNNRRLHSIAELASAAYVTAVEHFFSGNLLYKWEGENAVPIRIVELIERAFNLRAHIRKKAEFVEGVSVWSDTYQKARTDKNHGAFSRLALIGRAHGLVEWSKIAVDAEQLANATRETGYPDAVKMIWNLAARAFINTKDKESEIRCRSYAVDQVHEMILGLAMNVLVLDKIKLHVNCQEKRGKYFLSAMMGKSFSDDEGKVIATAPSANLSATPSEEWFDYESLTEADIHYHISVESFIKPACAEMSRNHPFNDRHFIPITGNSAFVPHGQEAIFALGFARFVQGDMISACHLLIPQLENSLRYVLKNIGTNTAKFNQDLTQEDQSLPQMYNNRRAELEQTLGVNVTYAIHLLFNLKGGPMLRHEMAHGKMSASQCFHPASIYACWLIFYLTLAPTYPYWSTHISQMIQEASE